VYNYNEDPMAIFMKDIVVVVVLIMMKLIHYLKRATSGEHI
jgi:hypothetical protein